jgi:hypothetical protein
LRRAGVARTKAASDQLLSRLLLTLTVDDAGASVAFRLGLTGNGPHHAFVVIA